MRAVLIVATFLVATASQIFGELKSIVVPSSESASYESDLRELLATVEAQAQTVKSLPVPLTSEQYEFATSIKNIAGAAGAVGVLTLPAAEVGCIAEQKIVETNVTWMKQGKRVSAGGGNSACWPYQNLLEKEKNSDASAVAYLQQGFASKLCNVAQEVDRNIFAFCWRELPLKDLIVQPGFLDDINSASRNAEKVVENELERDRYAIASFLFSGGDGLVDDKTRLVAYRLGALVYNSMSTGEVCQLEQCRSKRKLYQDWFNPHINGQHSQNQALAVSVMVRAMAAAGMIDEPDAPPSVDLVTYPPPPIPGWSEGHDESVATGATAAVAPTPATTSVQPSDQAPQQAQPEAQEPSSDGASATEPTETPASGTPWGVVAFFLLAAVAVGVLLLRRRK